MFDLRRELLVAILNSKINQEQAEAQVAVPHARETDLCRAPSSSYCWAIRSQLIGRAEITGAIADQFPSVGRPGA